jgi:MoxR-like ATPase
VKTVQQFATSIANNIEQVILGKREVIDLLIVALLCEGHVLLQDVPGTGKTMLARSLAISLGGSFKRLQCTPDLLPNDVTGVSIFNQQTSQFEFRAGPVFVNVLLADEINRATPRTQSALLEAMQEQQVTVDGVTRPLPRPFLVLATQNPIEYEGTFPLPEAQLDRFLIRLPVGYPSPPTEKLLFDHLRRDHPINHLEPLKAEYLGTDELPYLDNLPAYQRKVWDIFVDDSLQEYIIRLVCATREHPDLALGGSPRASLALFKTAQALAALNGRDHVLPDDIKFMAPFTLIHRLIVRPEAELRNRSARIILDDVIRNTPIQFALN